MKQRTPAQALAENPTTPIAAAVLATGAGVALLSRSAHEGFASLRDGVSSLFTRTKDRLTAPPTTPPAAEPAPPATPPPAFDVPSPPRVAPSNPYQPYVYTPNQPPTQAPQSSPWRDIFDRVRDHADDWSLIPGTRVPIPSTSGAAFELGRAAPAVFVESAAKTTEKLTALGLGIGEAILPGRQMSRSRAADLAQGPGDAVRTAAKLPGQAIETVGRGLRTSVAGLRDSGRAVASGAKSAGRSVKSAFKSAFGRKKK